MRELSFAPVCCRESLIQPKIICWNCLGQLSSYYENHILSSKLNRTAPSQKHENTLRLVEELIDRVRFV
jgi:hypothetical protein